MVKLGLPVDAMLDTSDGKYWDRERVAMFMEADITCVYQSLAETTVHMMQTAKALSPMRDSMGDMRWPPTMVVDTDDDLFNVQPLNVTYSGFGTRDGAGNQLSDGDEIGVAHPFKLAPDGKAMLLNDEYPDAIPGSRGDWKDERFVMAEDGLWHEYMPLWKDGANIDFKRNRERIGNWTNVVKEAHLVTVSTPLCGSQLQTEVGVDLPLYVSYNGINFEDYPAIDLAQHPGEVWILWQGSGSHQEDLWPISGALKRVADKYPQAKFIFFGAPYKWAVENLSADRVKFIPWVDYRAYTIRLSAIGHDISICPLKDHIFNRSRSAIKWYESSAAHNGAATLAQRTGAYAAEIQEGETGLLFSTPQEFEVKLGGLIEDAVLRQKLVANSRDWVRTHRDSKKLALALFQKWTETREGYKIMTPTNESAVAAAR